MAYTLIGRRTPKIDATAKVTGAANFATDMYLPGMLWAKVLRSPHPHAKILSIDTSKAKKLLGVKAVISAEDVPDRKYGALVFDMGMFARGKVRYLGESVAAVAAVDRDVATEAVSLIKVEYEILSAVYDPLESMSVGAPIIHDDLENYVTLFERTERSMLGNVNYQAQITQGDIDVGLASSDIVLEDTFRTQKQHPSYLESNSTVASFDAEGRLLIYNTTQRPHINQAILSSLLELPAAKIRVVPCYVGGGFGAKNRTLTEHIAAALAQQANAPVRLTLSAEEEFTSSTTRHSTVIKMKTGVKRDGTLVASEMSLVFDCGAYAPTPNAVWLGSVSATGPYRIPHTKLESFSVYTNKMMAGALRGYGGAQVMFAREVQMDKIANELHMDPAELRLKNCFRAGDSLHTGQKLASVNIEATIRQATEKMGWGKPGGKLVKNRALGISCAMFPCGGFGTSSIVRMNGDATATVSTGAMDMGQGLRTVMAQLAAEELGITIDDVTVISGDTDSTPFDVGIFGDRGTHTAGMAVKLAATDAKNQILALAADKMEACAQDLKLEGGRIFVKGTPDRYIELKAILGGGGQYKKGGPVIGKASINPETPPYAMEVVRGAASRFFSTYTFATVIVEVDVDPLTGITSIVRATASNDCGTVINPDGAEGQVDGGFATGLGYGLLEEVVIQDGQVVNPNFLDYCIPTVLDMPELSRGMVDSYDANGPFGAKGIGNVSVNNVAPAIANAISAAVGVRVQELPITPERIMKLLKKGA